MGEIQPSQHCNTKCSVIIDRGQFRAVNGKKTQNQQSFESASISHSQLYMSRNMKK